MTGGVIENAGACISGKRLGMSDGRGVVYGLALKIGLVALSYLSESCSGMRQIAQITHPRAIPPVMRLPVAKKTREETAALIMLKIRKAVVWIASVVPCS